MSQDKDPPEELESTRSADSVPRESPRAIGPYRLLQKIGEGGMGEVYEAEQTEPVRRRVALKIIKHGMDTKQVVARLEAERQALAMMDHPCVAKVFDAGSTPRGRPYFAMELVHGVPITEHCDRQRLTTRERLRLYMKVCDGVQHAHQKAIIHRDIKPSNVLVAIQDGKPVPKIIDFGVAKAMAQRLTDRTLLTEMGVMIGTPEYMSPEQAEMTGQNIDTRTDVYALGVLLYELLVGALPFEARDLRQAGHDEIRRRIREEEPSKPSTRIGTLGDRATGSATRRRSDPASLRRQLRGDLDWITMRALEKDRARRYGSPSELAADIARHLAHEPVQASPPSTVYRATKFVRRHRFGVTAAAVGVLALIGFGATMAVQAKRIASERDRAEQAQADLESVVEFQAGMLSGMDIEAVGRRLIDDLRGRVEALRRGRDLSETDIDAAVTSFEAAVEGLNATDAALRVVDEEILARALATLEERFTGQPLIDAHLRDTIGRTYWSLGLSDRAEPLLAKALETRRRSLGADHVETLATMNEMANVYHSQARYAEAEPLRLETLEARRRLLGADHPDTLEAMYNLAGLYAAQRRFEEAESLFTETLEARRRVLGVDHPATISSQHWVAICHMRQRRFAEAEPLVVEALEKAKRVLGSDHRLTLNLMKDLATLYVYANQYDEAEPLSLEHLESLRRVLGTDHPLTLASMHNLADLYLVQGRHAESEVLNLETLEARRRVLGPRHPSTSASLYNLACLNALQGNAHTALDWLRQAVDAGWLGVDVMARDPDLELLHGPEFDAILERARANVAKQRAE